MHLVDQLHRSIDSRLTPEQVCAIILQTLDGRLTFTERRLLKRAVAARPSLFTSMSEDFDRPVPADHKVGKVVELLGLDLSAETVARLAGDPWLLLGELRTIGMLNGWTPGTDFRLRSNRETRTAAGLDLSKRRYNRLMRQLARTHERAQRLQQQILLRQLSLVARSGLAYTITRDEIAGDLDAACFVAYWAAQKNRRREFTLSGRDNPFDTIAEMLMARCVRNAEGTDWWMVARAYPDPDVLARLDDGRRGTLMADWFGFVTLGARMLQDLHAAWPARTIQPFPPDKMWAARPGLMPPAESRGGGTRPVVELSTMIVAKGVDSSTWNTVAGAYNAARAGWINCLSAAGALELLDAVCPGKAMRLIAADLAARHRRTGGEPDRQTRVWARLPLPWQVLFDDDIACDTERVEYECLLEGVDPHATGWTAPRQHAGVAAEFKPTPELVHGIEVADPLWAGMLRRAGAWSGKELREPDVIAAYIAESGAYPAEQAGGPQ